jgi:hypothetical protein
MAKINTMTTPNACKEMENLDFSCTANGKIT